MKRVLSHVLATAVLATGMGAAPVEKSNSGPKQARSEHKAVSKTVSPKPYQVGRASWYGKQFDGRATASGEPFDMYQFTAAHRTLPLGTQVRVTNLANGRAIVVRINDRGPWIEGRVLDLSYAAARVIDMHARGVGRVRIDIVPPAQVAMASLPIMTN